MNISKVTIFLRLIIKKASKYRINRLNEKLLVKVAQNDYEAEIKNPAS